MAVFTTTIDGAIHSTALNFDNGILYVSVFVEEDALVALTTAKDVARERMSNNLSVSTRHTNRTGCHRDVSRAIHIGGFATAIDVGQDMTAANGHICISFDLSSTVQIYTSAQCVIEVRHTTGTATKHVAIVGMAVGSDRGSTRRFLCMILIIIIFAFIQSCRIRVVRSVW